MIRAKLDRHPLYITIHLGLMFVALSLMHWLDASSVIAAIPDVQQDLLASVLLVGSGMALAGSASGTRLFFPNSDVRVAYILGFWGLVSVVGSMTYYTWYLHENRYIIGTLASLVPFMGVGFAWIACIMAKELWRITHVSTRLIKELERE